jgi:TonB family protein
VNVKENLIPTKKKKKILLFFWISLLIHAIFLLIIFFNAFKKQQTFIIIPLQKQDLKTLQKLAQRQQELKKAFAKTSDLPASLKPRKSEFGSTVFFDDKAQFTTPQAKLTGPQDQEGKDLTQPKAQPQPQVKKQQAEQIAEKIKQELQKKEEKKVAEKEPVKESRTKEIKVEKKEGPKITQAQKKADEAKKEKPGKDIEKRIKEIEEKQKMVSGAQKLPDNVQLPKMQKLKTFGTDAQDKSPIVSTKKSIISMTKGFIENFKNEGSDWLERKGDDSKRPSFEELKYISYEEKVNWHLQSSWKQNFASNPTLGIPEGKAVVEFLVHADGTVHDLTLLQSSGSQQLDQVILKSIEFASPLPPLPQHFGTDTYKTGRIIHVTHHLLKF